MNSNFSRKKGNWLIAVKEKPPGPEKAELLVALATPPHVILMCRYRRKREDDKLFLFGGDFEGG